MSGTFPYLHSNFHHLEQFSPNFSSCWGIAVEKLWESCGFRPFFPKGRLLFDAAETEWLFEHTVGSLSPCAREYHGFNNVVKGGL